LPVEELLMTNWVCRQDGVVFPVGLPRCPELTCRARDAYEQGGDESINVYDAVAVTGIQDPGAAWDAVNAVTATARHELHRDGGETVSQTEGVSALLSSTGEGEVSERLGLVPGDSGAADASSDPDPVTSSGTEVLEETGESAGSAPARTRAKKDVPS
jgi:hypothetical protein